MFFSIFLLISLAALAYYFYIYSKYQFFKRLGIPGPEPKYPYGNVEKSAKYQENIIYVVDDIYRKYKNVAPFCGFYEGFHPFILPTDPQLLKQMCIKDFRKFRNNDFRANEKIDPIMARNPFWMRDEAWKEKRHEVMSATSTAKLKAMYPLIIAAAENFNNYVAKEIAENPEKAFEARKLTARYTCDSICSTTFGNDAKSFDEEDPFFLTKGRELIRGIADSFQRQTKKILPKDIEDFFIDFSIKAIKIRSEMDTKQEDFLTYTIAMKDKKGMSDIDAAAHCVTLFLDGYETTGVTLHNALYLLGYHKRVQNKLRMEILDALGDADHLTYDKLLELPYLNQVFYEVMRLHPPLVMSTRYCEEDFEYPGFDGKMMKIKKDTAIWIPIFNIQRDPDHFTDPETFIPERFNPEFGGVKAFKDRFVLIPFGDGPRICSGMRFAYMQVKVLLAEVLTKFEISLEKGVPDPESYRVSPYEFLSVPIHKMLLNFKVYDKTK